MKRSKFCDEKLGGWVVPKCKSYYKPFLQVMNATIERAKFCPDDDYYILKLFGQRIPQWQNVGLVYYIWNCIWNKFLVVQCAYTFSVSNYQSTSKRNMTLHLVFILVVLSEYFLFFVLAFLMNTVFAIDFLCTWVFRVFLSTPKYQPTGLTFGHAHFV